MMGDGGMKVLSEKVSRDGKTTFRVMAWTDLEGSADPRLAQVLYYARNTGMALKTVRISVRDSAARIEPGALYYMHGNLRMEASTGGGILAGLTRKLLTGEPFLVNQVVGTGDIYLEPTFGHFILTELDGSDGGRVANKGMFYAGSGDLKVSAARAKTLVAAGLGGEGLFETLVDGQGIAAFYSPVPESEIQEVRLENQTLMVDGNFAVMRSRDLRMHVTKSNKSWVGTSVGGEGLLNTYEGTGTVWLAPTQVPYERISGDLSLKSLAQPLGAQGKKNHFSLWGRANPNGQQG